LTNQSSQSRQVEVLDGLQNLLPAGTPRFTQTVSSNLVDAYKWTERDESSSLALYTLYSAITDRAEPVEALRANTVFSLCSQSHQIYLTSECVAQFKNGALKPPALQARGVRSSYFIAQSLNIAAEASETWTIVANVEQDQQQVATLQSQLEDQTSLQKALSDSCQDGNDNLARIMASADGFQTTAEAEVSLHHYANTLFNVLRGGIFADQYRISRDDLAKTIAHFNQPVFKQHQDALAALAETVSLADLQAFVTNREDPQLQRLVQEYLPITFGRRHGDPSRPWNQFAIELTDDNGQPLLSYQGNWRDIFQNWEALSLSFPRFTESVIAKFVNASTVDGYNPYRITKQGIDWEVEEPDDPWSYIGYWGDHQIIYLQKLLELSANFQPQALRSLLDKPIFSYANVPYRIKAFEDIIKNPKDTVEYDEALAETIEQRVQELGADGKLVLQQDGRVYQVNLMEKLLVPLLTKLSNLVVDGGIWLNTQRPEWNDANNALVGQGLSMVTLCYLNRYLVFLKQTILANADTHGFAVTSEVATWLIKTTEIISQTAETLEQGALNEQQSFSVLQQLGELASHYRRTMYTHDESFNKTELSIDQINALIDPALKIVEHSIKANFADTGLYHAYNVLHLESDALNVGHLYSMLEGQVAVLSSGALSSDASAQVIGKLFDSDMYRPDQHTFMLYPDRPQQRFLNKNVLSAQSVEHIPLLPLMLGRGDTSLVLKDAKGNFRFNSDIVNANALIDKWSGIVANYPDAATESALEQLLELHESVFNHSAFTGRSGGMFGFEGLGCIYWHMVSKLLLAIQETAISSYRQHGLTDTTQLLISQYYHVREGIGFNKTPQEYGAFPADPYSHTPKHAGAQQPGMTGQVKEELITRLGELGGFVQNGSVVFEPFMLRAQEFTVAEQDFRYLAVNDKWETIKLPPASIGFSWCQVPVVFTLTDEAESAMQVILSSGELVSRSSSSLTLEESQDMFERNGNIKQIEVNIPRSHLYQA
jgi:hypothetical protein